MAYISMIPSYDAGGTEIENLSKLAKEASYQGADELYFYQYSEDEKVFESFLHEMKEVSKQVDIPFMIGIYVRRFEDVKKAFYTGASKVVLNARKCQNTEVILEAVERFGGSHIVVDVTEIEVTERIAQELTQFGVKYLLLSEESLSKAQDLLDAGFSLYQFLWDFDERTLDLIRDEGMAGICLKNPEGELMGRKQALKAQGIQVNTFDSCMKFSELKTNTDGLVPCIVQDFKTDEVLMMAYMNQEAFEKTVASGRMTYYSRSRECLWIKGETSGHYQYVKELKIDCDNDTLLAKVVQIGAACHTGNRSCFYRDLIVKEYSKVNPLTVLTDVYDTIIDRRLHPKEGSYTNYLFDKGIDKILKKCGEEATEIVIAAKNPDAEELKYEISDFLYHMMVLMAECGLDWNDIIKELSHRR
ncbi:bifunctional phosphoribosyl-AMP cyclohydrolase/phosphoribosyl-ATP diphosphatase HisIE [Anaerolentibacter hominis]|uniref:bifunctional phosphoribosyl-AMP cyclohydrolase/phosphoribosyl-ATP diphosphatase HisIE n=1 Tax=Anaerolentibacter hominis TaxID=3079009 RepID=UPI0031B81AF5